MMCDNHFPYEAYVLYRKHSFKNKIELQASNKVACFFCYAVFDAKEIVEYVDVDDTDLEQSKN